MIIAMFKKVNEKENKQKVFYNEEQMEAYMNIHHCILIGVDGEDEPIPDGLCCYLMPDYDTCFLSERECTCLDRKYNNTECKQI